METDEPRSHSFIVKVWIEEATAKHAVRWRGYITHVPDNRRRYVDRVEPLVEFIGGYLEAMGVRFSWWSRLRHWARFKRSADQD
jgi:hypothetical protein